LRRNPGDVQSGDESPHSKGESSQPKLEPDIRKGFVYKRVPHITLKSIATNEEIDTIHARWQEQLEPLRSKLNKALGKKWEEWDVPRPDAALTPGPSPKGRGKLLKKTGAANLFMVFGETYLIRPDHRRNPLLQHRRHRLLVHRHQLQRGELFRAPRLLHRRGPAV